ncbi:MULTISPECIES: hypothetical protein [Klebsiella]|jgi:hypothetical protein|nr:hypothetical protein [Klebsiella michiganensis]KSY15675.1 hypothetical protein APT98_21085 [Klebsiella quasipneumoniae]HCQ8039826.1 hypothetical protein [Klebsiella quasipneumoniae subsp. quasipneumoniae]HEF8933456.1 hypothetical protein [Klebsiella pneumoniae]ELS4497598.1 hypothetical protein [Klebsiella michiganensis]ELS4630556.1 hypothetical protein [Klebsiella michiganensis]
MMKTEPAEENIAEITDKRLTIGMDEPPVLRVLDALCYNEKRRAMNYLPPIEKHKELMVELGKGVMVAME